MILANETRYVVWYKNNLGPFLQSLIHRVGRRFGMIAVFVGLTAYGLIFFFGPQGVQALLEKQREIRHLQEQNSQMSRENEQRRERIKRLQENRSEQEMEIRKQLKLQRPGETTFILPDGPKDAPKDAPATQH
jgi:cell division protein FtsB